MPETDYRIHATRREALMERLPGGVTLVRGAGADGPNPSFFYLTGIPEPRGALLLAPQSVRIGTGRSNPGPNYVHGRRVRQVLFLPERDPLAARWGEDSAATSESVAAEEVGVDAVLGSAGFEALLTAVLAGGEALNYVRATAPSLAGQIDGDSAFVSHLTTRFIGLEVHDVTGEVHAMRRLKDASEIAAVERAVALTVEAQLRVMRTVRPGMREYEAEAEIARVYRGSGASHAFDPIVACGPNAMLLHYVENTDSIDAGRLLLIDTGASLDGYKGDVTRTIPVDGKFTARQREIYEVVLRSLEETTAACRPGALLGDLHAIAFEVIEKAGFGEFFIHGVGHHLGLETHDVGDVHEPLDAGAIVTVEPGIYIPDEGIGIRIEDDVLITADGARVLSEAAPKSVEAIEALMAESRS